MRNYIARILCACAAALMVSCAGRPNYSTTTQKDDTPAIWPDYKDVTIPSTIAPLNFDLEGSSSKWLILSIKGSVAGEMECEGNPLDIDIDQWHKIVEQNKGGYLSLSLSSIYQKERVDYKPFKIYVSQNDIEQYGVTYRRIAPGYEKYGRMGIYERNISNFDERAIFQTTINNACVNCHTPNRTNSSQSTFHVRGKNGFTFLKNGDKIHTYSLKTENTISAGVYPYWHPTGRYVAYSNNQTAQKFHTQNINKIEVFDGSSDIIIFDVEKEEVVISPQMKVDTLSETFPAFSPDGKTLYYCLSMTLDKYKYIEKINYCLMKASFDEQTGKITGQPDTLLAIPGKSISFPRPSYDGKYLMFTVCDYGTFPIWHHEADLYMLDLQCKDSVRYFPAEELNSNDTESFHNWSANSKWVVFASRRGDGLYTRLYLAEALDSGKFSKPFLLPQRQPKQYYSQLFDSYNTPDFCDKPLEISVAEMRNMAEASSRETVRERK